jgi:hypothetical protein
MKNISKQQLVLGKLEKVLTMTLSSDVSGDISSSLLLLLHPALPSDLGDCK